MMITLKDKKTAMMIVFHSDDMTKLYWELTTGSQMALLSVSVMATMKD